MHAIYLLSHNPRHTIILKSRSNSRLGLAAPRMSSSRRSRQQSGGSRIPDDQIIRLVSKLQQQVPELRNRRSDKVSATKVLQETCNYIRNLHREVEDLSDRITQILATLDADSEEATIIRSLLN